LRLVYAEFHGWLIDTSSSGKSLFTEFWPISNRTYLYQIKDSEILSYRPERMYHAINRSFAKSVISRFINLGFAIRLVLSDSYRSHSSSMVQLRISMLGHLSNRVAMRSLRYRQPFDPVDVR
jgi:hypothetical protein